MERIRKEEEPTRRQIVLCLAYEKSRTSLYLGVLLETEVKKFARYAPHEL